MRISDIKECLDRMHTIYAFDDKKTDMCFETDPRMGADTRVRVETYDSETDVEVILSTTAHRKENV